MGISPQKTMQEMTSMNIDCVIIGINTEKTIEQCIRNLLASHYSRGTVNIYYVDGGSTDQSIRKAQAFDGVNVIALNPRYPTPGLGRNNGWKAGTSPLVQFLDSDAMVHPQWLNTAVDALMEDDTVGAVRGNRYELYPLASVFNWIGDMEWNAAPGFCDAFGGDVMVRRSILEDTGGYDEVLVAGEDPELSRRIQKKGWKILQINTPMCGHDLAMMHLSQYWKRGHRTGYGYAAVTARYGLSDGGFWIRELLRICVRGGGFVGSGLAGILFAFVHPLFLILFFPGLVLLFYPFLFKISWFMENKHLKRKPAMVYALHCSFVVIPQFFGVKRFFWGKLFHCPLRNKPATLKTDISR